MTVSTNEQGQQVATLDFTQKVIGVVLLVASSIITGAGSYFATKAVTEWRLTQTEAQVNELRVRQDATDKQQNVMALMAQTLSIVTSKVDAMERVGHPDHERRIAAMEAWRTALEPTLGDINTKLAVMGSTLTRIDKQLQDKRP